MFVVKRSGLFTLLWLITLLIPLELAASVLAGKVQFVVGKVNATSTSGEVRQLKKGDWIFSGDTIKSGENGSAQLIFKDRSRMAVRVNTEFKIDSFSFDKNKVASSKSEISLVKGALRAVTGLIGSNNKSNVSIKTPVTTIGIRGTDHEVIHLTPEFSLDKQFTDIGTYNRVYAGATVMKANSGQVLNLGLNDIGYVGGTPSKIFRPVKIKALPVIIEKQLIHKIPMQAENRKHKLETPASQDRKRSMERAGVRKPSAVKPGIAGRSTLLQPMSSKTLSTSTLSPALSTSTLGTTKTLDSSVLTSPTLSTTTVLEPTKTLSTTTVLEPTISTTTLDTTTTTKTLDTTTTISPLLISPLITK